MKTLLLFVAVVSASPALGQARLLEFIGDKSKMVYYPLVCTEARQVDHNNSVPLFGKDDADAKGFKPADACTEPKPKTANTTPADVQRKTVSSRIDKLSKLIQLTSEPSDYFGKVVSVYASVDLTDNFKYSDDDYSFRLHDGSASLYVFMEKRSAQRLRELLLSQPEGSVAGRFVLYMHPGGYKLLGRIFGKLVSYDVSVE